MPKKDEKLKTDTPENNSRFLSAVFAIVQKFPKYFAKEVFITKKFNQ